METAEGADKTRRVEKVGGEIRGRTSTEMLSRRGNRCVIVAEIGNIHDGSLGNCHSFIDACWRLGVDAVKFQVHLACESTEDEQFPRRFQFHPQDQNREDYWRRMSFTRDQWAALASHSHDCGLAFILSPFSVAAFKMVFGLPDMWKVASGELGHHALLELIADDIKPIILSTGMSNEKEIELALQTLRFVDRPRNQCYVLQCTTEYPTGLDHVGLNFVEVFSRHVGWLGGISDHSGTIWPGLFAAVLGAAMVEVHACWDKRQFGADASSSLTIDELEQLSTGIRAWEYMRDHPVDKDAMAVELEDTVCYVKGKNR